ncbi:hypothetical protein FQN60_001677 [Etheostoma spectabile]|uniref:Uncharacterized protein n=1 Tax=Etheostoma spectabile TaxID=54343 RepID=A0A5J5DB13_9PERO|nr:hypothetical protein FQN60_001677 [Etheostoma spectabile]
MVLRLTAAEPEWLGRHRTELKAGFDPLPARAHWAQQEYLLGSILKQRSSIRS